MAKYTTNLKIPLLNSYDMVGKDGINKALNKIDEIVVGAVITNWQPKTKYAVGAFVISGNLLYKNRFKHTSSESFNEDKTNWLLINYQEYRMWADFKEITFYKKGDVFKTSSCPSWGFWVVIKAGTSDETAPYGQKEGDIAESGDMKCQLSRLLNSADICTKKKALTYSLLF